MWIRIDAGLNRHPKTYRLARALGVSRAEAAGLIVGLLGYLSAYHVDGSLVGLDLDAAIEHAGGAPAAVGRPADVLSGLVRAGWIDRTVDGVPVDPTLPGDDLVNVVFTWHDWDDWQGKLIDNREADAARKRSDRHARAALRDTRPGRPTGRPSDVPTPSDARPAATERNGTEREETGEDTPPPPPSASAEGKAVAKLLNVSVTVLKDKIAGVYLQISAASRAEHRLRAGALFVFWYWAHVMERREGDTIADPKRITRIEARLREGPDFHKRLSQVLYAIDGAKRDRNLMGDNAAGKRYDGVETVLRDAGQVERLSVLCREYREGKEHPLIKRAEEKFAGGIHADP